MWSTCFLWHNLYPTLITVKFQLSTNPQHTNIEQWLNKWAKEIMIDQKTIIHFKTVSKI